MSETKKSTTYEKWLEELQEKEQPACDIKEKEEEEECENCGS